MPVARTITLYKNAYSGLTPSTWWLSFVMLINRSGTMVLPFMTIYLTSPAMGYTIGQAGIVMGLWGLGAVTGAFFGGRLTDKVGFYPVQLLTLIGGGILFIILGQMNTYPLICLFTFLLSTVNEAFRPANSTAIVAYSRPDNLTRSYALNRLAINMGWAVGNAIGGVLASINYKLLFYVDGCTNIAAAILLWYVLRPSRNVNIPAKKKEAPDPALSAYKDTNYLWFLLLTIFFAACFFQLFNNLPAYYRNELHFSEKFIGLTGSVNGILISVFEMVLVYKLDQVNRRHTYFIVRGIFLCGLAYMLLNIFPVTHVLAILMMIVMTFGEILSLPFMNTFWASRSAEHNRGQYAALYTIAWSIAQTFGPALGAQLAEHSGFGSLWWAAAGLCFVVVIGFAILHKALRPPPK